MKGRRPFIARRLVVRGQCDEALQPMPTHRRLGTAEDDDCVVLGLASAIARLSCTLYPGAVVVAGAVVGGGGGVSPAAAVPPSETDILHTCGWRPSAWAASACSAGTKPRRGELPLILRSSVLRPRRAC